jgi:hypothetical protein
MKKKHILFFSHKMYEGAVLYSIAIMCGMGLPHLQVIGCRDEGLYNQPVMGIFRGRQQKSIYWSASRCIENENGSAQEQRRMPGGSVPTWTRLRGGSKCSSKENPDLEDIGLITEAEQHGRTRSGEEVEAAATTSTGQGARGDAGQGGIEFGALQNITTELQGTDDSDFEELNPDAKGAYEGCTYSEVKVKPRAHPDKQPQPEPVQLWDCLVTTHDGTVIDIESANARGGDTGDYQTGGYVTLHLPSHGVALQLARNSRGAFRFRCSPHAPVMQASSQGHWSEIASVGLEAFEYPAALGMLEEEGPRRTRSLAKSVRWHREAGVERLRAGKWSLERVWPGSNVCILNLDTGDLQIWLTPRGFYLFGAACEGRSPTGRLSASCFEVVAPDRRPNSTNPSRDADCFQGQDEAECDPQEGDGGGRRGREREAGNEGGDEVVGGDVPRVRIPLEAREELQTWVLQGTVAFEGGKVGRIYWGV